MLLHYHSALGYDVTQLRLDFKPPPDHIATLPQLRYVSPAVDNTALDYHITMLLSTALRHSSGPNVTLLPTKP